MQAKDIVKLACQIAKGPQMLDIGANCLSLVLEDLCQNRNLKLNRLTQMLTVPANSYGPFQLEADYLRTYDLFYPIPSQVALGGQFVGGITQFLVPITMEQFDAEFKDPSTANYPYEFATDLSTQAQQWVDGTPPVASSPGKGSMTSAGQLWIYPQISGQVVMTHRYMCTRPVLSQAQCQTNAIPWFPFADYLVEATAARVMGVTGDDRRDRYLATADKMLAPYLIMQGDEQQTPQSIRLDPKHFRPHVGTKPVKSYPF